MNKRILALVALAAISGLAQATEYGRVLSSTPVTREVTTPQRVCRNEEVVVEKPHDASGSIIGAVAGGILGSTMGRGSGNAAATAAGVIVGAVAGDKVANSDDTATTRTVQRCGTRQVRSQQLVGYDVEYEYAGKHYKTRMSNDPGDRIAIQVAPAGAVVSEGAGDDSDIVYDDPVTVVRERPVYVSPSPAISVDLGWGRGWGPGWGAYPHHGPRW
jgi:uncharacterized protein YcfJ